MATILDLADKRFCILGPEVYTKNCLPEKRWDLPVSKELVRRIAQASQEGFFNIRIIQGRMIDIEDGKSPWFGDNLGRIAEGLSKGKIQLHQDGAALEDETWTPIPRSEAKDWKDVNVVYVYSKVASENLTLQADENSSRMLYTANRVYHGQFVTVIENHTVVVGDTLDDVCSYVINPLSIKTL